jgi:hypothetical protein
VNALPDHHAAFVRVDRVRIWVQDSVPGKEKTTTNLLQATLDRTLKFSTATAAEKVLWLDEFLRA